MVVIRFFIMQRYTFFVSFYTKLLSNNRKLNLFNYYRSYIYLTLIAQSPMVCANLTFIISVCAIKFVTLRSIDYTKHININIYN